MTQIRLNIPDDLHTKLKKLSVDKHLPLYQLVIQLAQEGLLHINQMKLTSFDNGQADSKVPL